ncbi:MAG: TRIC cation channel family protein [Clostridia bacterium]|nr:TRIC cation channel family protein [Clostridia bacterium]
MPVQPIFAIFEILGTVAFAISGAMEGIRHKMDIFGVCILGIVTATGGGILRDIVIGQIPPKVFLDPKCAVIAACVAILVFMVLRFYKKKALPRFAHVSELLYILSDTLGLGVFTVLGIQGAGEANGALLLFVGVITGVGGGVLRDVLSGTVPSIFRKHIYALASAAGAVAHILLMRVLPSQGAMLIGFGVVVVIRLLAAHYKWNLPRIE